MKKILILVFCIASLYAEKPNIQKLTTFAKNGIEYGYSLPKAKDTKFISRKNNIIKCSKLNTVIEQYFCIYGVLGKTLGNKMPIIDSVVEFNIKKVADFANSELRKIGHQGYQRSKRY